MNIILVFESKQLKMTDEGKTYYEDEGVENGKILGDIVKVEPNDPKEIHDNLYKFKIYAHESIDITDEYGRTAIQFAIQNNQINIVEYIFENFYEQTINDKDDLGFNILHYAGKYFFILHLFFFFF